MLRNLIMGLLLANLLLLAWGRWIVPPDAADPWAFGNATGVRLVLAEPAGRTGGAARDSAPDGERCFRLGPFLSAGAATAVRDQLSERGLPAGSISESGQIWVGHWVQLLDLPSVEAARQVVATLVSGGIGDAYISSQAPTVDISLGVFRSRSGADDVIRLARDLGYAPAAMDRFRDGIEYWVEVATPADQPPNLADLPAEDVNSGEARIIRVEAWPCRLAAAVAGGGNGDGGNDSLESPTRGNDSPDPSALPE